MSKLRPYLADIASAIREKKGSSEPINAKDFSNEIRNIQSGAAPVVEEKDICFYDYDGTLLFSYTIAEAQALTELPTPKGHEGLVFQGWNWDYEDVIALDYPMDIGAMYITDDGKTRLYINVRTKVAMDVPLYFSQSVDRGVVIDWGDGTPTETIEGTGWLNTTHHYSDVGEYCISLDVVDNSVMYLGSNISNTSVLGLTNFNCPYTYVTYLEKVELGLRIGLKGNAFMQSNIKTINLPKDCKFDGAAFSYVSQLTALILPTETILTAAGKGSNQFANAYSIVVASLPKMSAATGGILNNCRNLLQFRFADSVQALSVNSYRGCHRIAEVVLPSSLTQIDGYAFGVANDMPSLRLLDCRRCKQIPTNQGNNTIPLEAIVVVPDALYDEWIVATNWSAIASQIMSASEYESIYS